ncbi:MAG: glycoside hydrolase family 127 protein, partial [Bifidobacteriaceae bacterium]|nr:glycoside hydrolase family 127 protein [Bifidobacteriaceae bacterium]
MTGQGAVAPLSRSRLASLRPLPAQAVTIESGPWHRRRQVNATAGLAHGLTQLRRAGTVGNFQTLADGTNAPHGHLGARDADVKSFVDSDVYKWLEAVAWTGDISPGLAAEASEIIDLIERAQDQDGYLNTWFQRQGAGARFADLGFGHELYCLGHLVQAGVAWSRARGDDRLATVSRKFADLVADVFTPTAAVCGH